MKTVHEASKITFVIVAVWREENRLIVYNGDLSGRVISVDADAWSASDLQKVIEAGETLLNTQFSAIEMYKWILYPVLTSTVEELTAGLTYRQIRTRIESRHPQGENLNLTQALQSVPALQAKKNIKPFVLDYDRSNLRLSVVDKGFLIWLASQDRKQLLEMLALPTLRQIVQSELGV